MSSGRAVILFLGLGLVGCATAPVASRRAPARVLRAATLDEVLSAYEGYCKGIETLKASGDLDVRDLRAGKSQKLGVRVVATRGGRLYLKGSVAVVTALEVVADGERFWIQVPSKKTVWTGVTGAVARDAGSAEAPYYVLRPADVTSALIPEPLAPGPDEALVLEGDGQAFCLTLARLDHGRGIARRRVWVDRDTLRLLRSRSYDAHGDLVSEVDSGGWADGSPRALTVRRPAEGYEAAFSLTKVETNAAVPDKAFVPRTPEDYKVVEVH